MKMKHTKIIMSIAAMGLLSSIQAKDMLELGNMTVTAQKVEENVQEVPLSISVFDEFTIEDKNIDTVLDIATHTPGFYLFDFGDMGSLGPAIRGLYSDPGIISTTVSMYIDGISVQSSIGYDAILEDIERIEVLKGPQGTLYGKNAEAGVINIVTKKPTNETKGRINLELGTDNKRQISLSASGPVVDNKFFVGLSGRYYEKDGFIKNTFLNQEFDYRENTYGKLYLRYLPKENLEVSLISSKFKRDDGASIINSLMATDPKEVLSDIVGFNKSETTTHALKAEYKYNDYAFSSTTAYKKDKSYFLSDMDYSPVEFFHGTMDKEYENLSQELRVNAQIERLKWLVGLYAEKNEADGGTTVSSINPMMLVSGFQQTTDDTSIGVFVHGEYDITKQLSILAGLRYDKDNKKITDKPTAITLDESFSEVSPKLSFKYAFDTNMMGYATISKGYRSGGFYMFAPTGMQDYDKETLWNYELGFKSILLDNRLILNGSIYYMDISDMQVLTNQNQVQGYYSNAASATSKGLELEVNYKITDAISIFSGLAFNKTKLEDFSDFAGDYSGNDAPFAPQFNYSLGVKYRDAKGFYGSVDLNGYDKMYIDKANAYEQDAYHLVNAKVGYETQNFDIYVYGKNVFDKNYNIEGYYGMYTYLSKPAEFGVQLSYRF